MEKEKERQKKTEREKGREKDFTGPGSSVGSVSRRVQFWWACAPGASVCVLLSSLCPSFREALELFRLIRCHVLFVLSEPLEMGQWAWGLFGE